MRKEELLRRLEERLARGEIQEKTYLDIKARYDAMPDESEVPGPRGIPEPPEPPEPPEHPHPVHGLDDLGHTIEETIQHAMESAAMDLEAAGTTREKLQAQMEEMNVRIQEALSQIGPRVEEGGRRIIVRGSGTLAGDTTTEEFRAAGVCRVPGNLRSIDVHVAGSCVIEGDCECEEFHASGKAVVGGGVKAKEFHSSGKSTVGKDVRANDVSIAGKAEIGGSILDAEDVSIGGVVRVGGWVRTKDFSSRGQFEIGEGIEAEDVSISLSDTSRVPVIKAKEVSVRRDRRRGELVVGEIEGESIDVEATKARIIRGHEVRVGPFCTVDVVEADEVEVHESSTVKERRPRAS